MTRLAEAAVAHDPHQSWWLLTLGAARYRAGDFGNAERLLRQAVAERWYEEEYRDSGQTLAWLFLSLTARRLGRPDPVGAVSGLPAGGQNAPWTATVPFDESEHGVFTIAVATGGHIAPVERFAITAVIA